MTYLHTCSIGVVNLFMAMVPLVHGDLLEFTGYVICGTRVGVSICVYSIGSVDGGGNLLLPRVIFDITPLAIFRNMVSFLTYLTSTFGIPL